MSEPSVTIEDVLSRLEGVKRSSRGRAKAKCPAHDDSDPSMTVREGDTCILMHCFAGCTFEDIVAAIGLKPEQLLYKRLQSGVVRKPDWAREAAQIRQMNMEAAASNE